MYSFQYHLGQRVFFIPIDAESNPCCTREHRIVEGKIIGCRIELDDVTPNDLTPTEKLRITYTLQCGAEAVEYIVKEEKLEPMQDNLYHRIVIGLDQSIKK